MEDVGPIADKIATANIEAAGDGVLIWWDWFYRQPGMVVFMIDEIIYGLDIWIDACVIDFVFVEVLHVGEIVCWTRAVAEITDVAPSIEIGWGEI